MGQGAQQHAGALKGSNRCELSIQEYSLCRPQNIVLRPAEPRLLQWRHVIGTSGLTITVGSEGAICLCHDIKVLERICDPVWFTERRGLRIVRARTLFLFRWATRRGYTAFQIRLSPPDSDVLGEVLSQLVEVCQTNDPSPSLYAPSLPARSEASLATERNGPGAGSGRSEASCTTRCTEVSHYTYNTANAKITDDRSFSLTARSSHRVELPATSKNPRLRDLNLKKLMTEPLHVAIRTLSRVRVPVQNGHRTNRRVIWEHLGLASGLVLSLLETKVVIMRADCVIQELKLDPSGLRAYFAKGIFGLKERYNDGVLHVQLQMATANVVLASQWLERRSVIAERRSDDSPTEATRPTSGWVRRDHDLFVD